MPKNSLKILAENIRLNHTLKTAYILSPKDFHFTGRKYHSQVAFGQLWDRENQGQRNSGRKKTEHRNSIIPEHGTNLTCTKILFYF